MTNRSLFNDVALIHCPKSPNPQNRKSEEQATKLTKTGRSKSTTAKQKKDKNRTQGETTQTMYRTAEYHN